MAEKLYTWRLIIHMRDLTGIQLAFWYCNIIATVENHGISVSAYMFIYVTTLFTTGLFYCQPSKNSKLIPVLSTSIFHRHGPNSQLKTGVCCYLNISQGSHVSLYAISRYHVDGLVEDCSISISNILEIFKSCTKPSMLCKVSLCPSTWSQVFSARTDSSGMGILHFSSSTTFAEQKSNFE